MCQISLQYLQLLKIQQAHDPQDLRPLHNMSVHRAGQWCHRCCLCRLLAVCTYPAAWPATPAVLPQIISMCCTRACSTLCQGYLLYELCLGTALSGLLSLRLNLGQLKYFHRVVSLPAPCGGSNPLLGRVHCRALDP